MLAFDVSVVMLALKPQGWVRRSSPLVDILCGGSWVGFWKLIYWSSLRLVASHLDLTRGRRDYSLMASNANGMAGVIKDGTLKPNCKMKRPFEIFVIFTLLDFLFGS